MSKRSLRIIITIHSNGRFQLLIEWISTNLSAGHELATPLCWG